MRKGHVEQARAFFQVIIVESNHCTDHSTRNIFDWGSFPKQVMQKKSIPLTPLPTFIILLNLFLEHFPLTYIVYQSAASLSPHQFECHYNYAVLSEKTGDLQVLFDRCFNVVFAIDFRYHNECQ